MHAYVAGRRGGKRQPAALRVLDQPIRAALRPWRSGTVYVLPGDTFELQPPLHLGEVEVRIPQLASTVAVRPLARVAVDPADFPFLAEIRGHDDDRLAEYAHAMESGAPWPE